MRKCENCGRDVPMLTLFRSLCTDCADSEFVRLTAWYESGDEPIRTIADLDDFVLGALFHGHGKGGLLGLNCWTVRSVVDNLPPQYVSVASSMLDSHGFVVEIKQPIPADVMREAVDAGLLVYVKEEK